MCSILSVLLASNRFRNLILVPGAGVEPACLAAQHLKCCVYANSTTQAILLHL